MSDGVPYADVVILALIAGFILLRLRSVLGNKTGNDNNPNYFTRTNQPQQQDQRDQRDMREPIVQLDEKSLKPKIKEEPDHYLNTVTDTAVTDAVNAIKLRDPLFTATRFLQGAKAAYEMVFDAFIKGDRQTLKMLLSDPLSQHFNQELDERGEHENKTETTLVSVKAKDITGAVMDKTTARLTVHFESEQVTVVRDSKGAIVEGNPSDIHHVEDYWVFERDTTSKNPNWKIIET